MNSHQKKSRGTLYFIVLGVISIVWLLLRVIPKPYRITYPCQRMATANAVTFTTWLFGTAIAANFFKKAFRKMRESKIPVAVVLIIPAVGIGATTVMLTSYKEIRAAVNRQINEIFTPPEALNSPMGLLKGSFLAV